MNSNFEASLAALESARDEGGYVDNPRDPGGATNHGITQVTYDKWRRSHGLLTQSVRDIAQEEVSAIYFSEFWLPAYCNQLPAGVDFCVFDFGVNSNVIRALLHLQRVVGVVQDAHVGPKTLAAVAAKPVSDLIDALCNDRLSYLQSLQNYSVFGDGWRNRVEFVRATAKQMAGGNG